MSLFEAPTTIPAGTYPCVVTHVGVETIETREGPKDLVRWEVELTTDDGPQTLDALSSLNFGARAKARQWAIALYHHLLAKGNLSRSIMRYVTACLAALGQAHDSISGSRYLQDPM